MYLEDVKQAYYTQFSGEIQGCSAEEIVDLEQVLCISLPVAYKEFLLWAGHNAGDVFDDIAQYRYSEIVRIQESARYITELRQFPTPLPNDAIVIVSYDDMMFHFICSSEGDDPPVYFFVDTAMTQTTKAEKIYYSHPRFSQWMLKHVCKEQ